MSRLVRFAIVILIPTIISIKCAKGDLCPTLSYNINSSIDYSKMKSFADYTIYRYKSVDVKIRSPFYIDEGSGPQNMVQLFKKPPSMSMFCEIELKNGNIVNFLYNNIDINELVEQDAINQYLLNLNYDTSSPEKFVDEVFCDKTGQMNQIYVLDFQPQTLLSLYGCLESEVDGSMVKYEGVLVLIGPHTDQSDVEIFKVTRDFLKQTEITWSSLNEPSSSKNDTICTQLVLRVNECKALKENEDDNSDEDFLNNNNVEDDTPIEDESPKSDVVSKSSGVRKVPEFCFLIILIALKRLYGSYC